MKDLYSEILKSEKTPMTESQVYSLKREYCAHILDSMDSDTLWNFAFDYLINELPSSEQELLDEIHEYYGEETLQNLIENSKQD